MKEKINHRDTEAQRRKTEKEETRERKPYRETTMDERDPLTRAVIGAAIEVHRELGPGLIESVYEDCLSCELEMRGIAHQYQAPLPVIYKGRQLDANLRLDIFLPGQLILELKAVEKLLPVHEAQLLTYLKLTKTHTGLLINFNVPILRDGIKRMVL
jgi:GxxExxY protein